MKPPRMWMCVAYRRWAAVELPECGKQHHPNCGWYKLDLEKVE